eukprot:5713009-Ditylum_brightwellii.AAC.1
MTPYTSDPLGKLSIKRIQAIIGTLLYYTRQVDPTMLVAIGTIAAAHSKGTEAMEKVVHSNTSYLLVPEARRRVGGYFFLGSEHDDQINGPLLVISTILRNVMALVAEAELGALFENAKEAAALQVTLEE